MANKMDVIKMEYPAKGEYVGVIRMTVSGVANRIGFSYEAIEDIKVAVSEAITNVVNHAYTKNQYSGKVVVMFNVYKEKLKIMISDNGDSFNLEDIKHRIGPVTKKEELKPVSEIRERGFGLFLMSTLMDRVKVDNDESGVIVFMTKYLDQSEVDTG